ncbi:MAG: RNA polymerase sigma factor [Bacteroidales bacterium]|nr:RNA polymerase sigma factor [Candidatus Latescibacterota bacterium]
MRGDRDHELVRRSIDGDCRAFTRIIEQNNNVVYSAVRAVFRGSTDIDDVVQDIFIKIFKGLPGFRHGAKLSTWIYRIARNEALNAVGKSKPSIPIDELPEIGTDKDRPDRLYEQKNIAGRLRDHISRLDARYRDVIELRYTAERSYSEISEILDLPEGTVKTYLFRAKVQLKRMMNIENGKSERE